MTDAWHIAQHTVCSPFLSIMIAVIHPVPFWGKGNNPQQRKDSFYRWESAAEETPEQMKFVITTVNKEAQPGHGPFHSPLLFFPLLWPEHQSANGNLSGMAWWKSKQTVSPATLSRDGHDRNHHLPGSQSPSTHERKRHYRDAKIYSY